MTTMTRSSNQLINVAKAFLDHVRGRTNEESSWGSLKFMEYKAGASKFATASNIILLEEQNKRKLEFKKV